MNKLYSTNELAKMLGLNVHTIRNYVREGRIAYVQVDKKNILFTEEAIQAFLKNHTKQT